MAEENLLFTVRCERSIISYICVWMRNAYMHGWDMRHDETRPTIFAV